MAVSTVDVALWDLKARLLDLPLATLLDAAHDSVPVYGSGGFTSYSLDRIREQLGRWVAEGIPRVKMKVGRDPEQDPARLDAAREAIGPDTELYVDANGALRLVRDQGPPGLEVAAGEYGYVLPDFVRLADAVDCLQADVTRCGGVSGLLRAAALAAARGLDVSAHCAPAVSATAFAAVPNLRHLEYFHDHVRVEGMLFDGVPEPGGGALRPDRSRPGLGLELRRADAERWAA
jgi:L-alanine-DL-glutamate epimerase-like enolase superfamily enzyme